MDNIISAVIALISSIVGSAIIAYNNERKQNKIWEYERISRQEIYENKQREKRLRIKGIIIEKLLKVQDDLYLTNINSIDNLYHDYFFIYKNFKSTYNNLIKINKLIIMYDFDFYEEFNNICKTACNIRNYQREFYCHALHSTQEPYRTSEWMNICDNSIKLKGQINELLDELRSNI